MWVIRVYDSVTGKMTLTSPVNYHLKVLNGLSVCLTSVDMCNMCCFITKDRLLVGTRN